MILCIDTKDKKLISVSLKKISKFYKERYIFYLVIVFYLITSSLYALMSVVNHSHFLTFSDLGIFNQAIWQYSQFKYPFSTFHLNRFFLGDHFHPILILLAPLYWIYPDEKILLVVQPFIMLFAIFPLFLISLKLTKSIFFSLSIIFAFSFYIPLQYTIFYDFHEIVFLPPLFAWAYYFFLYNNKKLLTLFLILSCMVKEEIGFFISMFGLCLFLFQTKWRKYGLALFILGILYTYFMIYVGIPFFGGKYLYLNYLGSKTILDLIKNPMGLINLFFDAPLKIETLYLTFWPYGFLPIFSPIGFLLSFEQFFTRFLDQRTISHWTIGYHYSAQMTIIVSIGSIWSVYFYTKFIPKYRKAIIICIGVLLIFLTRIEQINRSAILLVKRPQFWVRDIWMDNIDQAIRLIPKNASVAAQNNIISHLSTREKVYLLKDFDKADYIIVDLHTGQSDYNFAFGDNPSKLKEKINLGISSGKFSLLFHQNEVYLLKSKR